MISDHFRYQVQTLCVPILNNTAFYLVWYHDQQNETTTTKKKNRTLSENRMDIFIWIPDTNKGDEAKKVDTRTLGVIVTEKT